MQTGNIVKFRARDWVLVSTEDEVYRLRPLTGDPDSDICVHKGLSDPIAFNLRPNRSNLPAFPSPTLNTSRTRPVSGCCGSRPG